MIIVGVGDKKMGERLVSRGEREALSSGPCFFQSCVLAEAVRKGELGLLTAAHCSLTVETHWLSEPFHLLLLINFSDKQQTIMSIRGQTWRSKDLEFGVACLGWRQIHPWAIDHQRTWRFYPLSRGQHHPLESRS